MARNAVGVRSPIARRAPTPTKKRLQQAAKAVGQYAHRLAGLPARKKLDDTLRTSLLTAGNALTPDLKTLRTQARCP